MTALRLALLLPLALACGEARPERLQQPVYGGEPAPEDTAVVAVVNFAGGHCSGSVLAPTLVLTARHCVSKVGTPDEGVICGRTPFEPPESPGAIFVVPRPTITDRVEDYLPVAAIRMPEGYNDDLCGTDVVLLRLAEPLEGVTPLEPRLDAPVLPDEPYSVVGYGIDAAIEGKPSGERKRLGGLRVECGGVDCGDSSVRDNEWVGSGGPCSGDSGGPALDADERVIGVVSRGGERCSAPVFGDVASRAEWLKSEAIAAAELRQEPSPDWAPCLPEDGCTPPNATNDAVAESGCSVTRGSRPLLPPAIALLAALALRCRRRPSA